MNKELILKNIEKLISKYRLGKLGGLVMPEDENPCLIKNSKENYFYFTLPMALNYQRNSYKLWISAKQTYIDTATNFVFNPQIVVNSKFEDVKQALTKYKVALQPNKQTEIWIKLCQTFVNDFNGDIRNLFIKYKYEVDKIKSLIKNLFKMLLKFLIVREILMMGQMLQVSIARNLKLEIVLLKNKKKELQKAVLVLNILMHYNILII